MKRVIFGLIILFLTSLTGFSQKDYSKTLLSIDQKDYTFGEFMYVYNKNNGNDNSSVETKNLNEYLDLYVNFRLKVKEAEDRGMDTSAAFKNELAGYRTQLAKPYLTDKSIDEVILKEAYERLQWDMRASHILLTVPKDVSDNDSIAKVAYDKLIDIRNQIIDGKDFSAMAKKYSDDPSAQDKPAGRNSNAVSGNGGDLGYFTAFYMVYPFETAVYNTEVGEVSMPIRTQFGYHIVKVYDKIPELGKIEVKHINVKPKSNDLKADADAEAKIKEISEEIKSGKKTFEEAAMQYSDDKGSSAKGGLLPVFEVSRMVPEFISAISKLDVGEMSVPVKTQYGWHLIKLVKTITLPEYEKYLPTLKTKVARDSRSNRSKEAAISKFKAEFSFKEYPKNIESFYSVIDSSIYTNKWIISKADGFSKTLFKLERRKYTQQDFAAYVEDNQVMKHKGTIRYFTDKLYAQWVEKEVLAYKNSKLEEQYSDFRMLVQEYHDGILLFAISDEEIWGKAIKDTLGLEIFYEANKSNYMWQERIDAIIYKCSTDSIAEFVKKSLADNISVDSLFSIVNKNSALNLHYESNKYEAGSSDIIDQIKHEKGISNIVKVGSTYYVVDVKDIITATNKSLDEARGIITADYQNELEKNWIIDLNKNHKVVIDKELLNIE
ncbi:MAG: hypothetical protein DRI86_02635 [Bacteroidetes bacterium]|nr:MAG: hypothetical protein DRI86_02635 [Bacteroidota bacterium]